MNILYLTNSSYHKVPYGDASTLYRCYNFAEEWTRLGYLAHVDTLARTTPDLLDAYDVVVFLRPSLTSQLKRLLERCAQRNITAVADFDDLVFNPTIAEQSPSVLAGRASVRQIRELYQSHKTALQQFRHVTIATRALQQQVRSILPEVKTYHLANGLSSYWLEFNRHLDYQRKRAGELLYLPGSRSHDHDFKSVRSALFSALNAKTALKLKLVGPLSFDSGGLRATQLSRGPAWVNYEDLPGHICSAMACLAPLADNTFNRCKSHIKFLEAAAFGTPLIASAIPDMEQHEIKGLMFPESATDWTECLDKLDDPVYYHSCSNELYNYVRTHCMSAGSMPGLLEFLQSITSGNVHEPTADLARAV